MSPKIYWVQSCPKRLLDRSLTKQNPFPVPFIHFWCKPTFMAKRIFLAWLFCNNGLHRLEGLEENFELHFAWNKLSWISLVLQNKLGQAALFGESFLWIKFIEELKEVLIVVFQDHYNDNSVRPAHDSVQKGNVNNSKCIAAQAGPLCQLACSRLEWRQLLIDSIFPDRGMQCTTIYNNKSTIQK